MEKILCLIVIALCGVSAISFQDISRITAGTNARDNEFPYAVSLQQISQLSTFTRGHRCGGVLITYQHVLTAASCTYNIGPGSAVLIVPSEYRVFAGSAILTNDTSPDRIRVPVNITVHPDYIGPPAFVNDLAIITLNNPFPNTTVIPLPIPPSTYEPAENAPCIVAGWGSQNVTSTASVNLRYAAKYIYSQSLCTLQYNLQTGGPNVLPTMICAASLDILSAGCQGDQGNALVCNGGLAGILSITTGCYPSSHPELYTRVSNYTTWIARVTGGASTFHPGGGILFIFVLLQITFAKIVG